MVCSVEYCGRTTYAHGLCQKHNTRRKKGQSLTEKSVYEMSPADKLAAKFTVADNGCWLWNNPRADGRCNTFLFNGKVMSAYRASFIMHKGDIPEGKLVCHSCDDGRCVNPDHLWLGDYRDNRMDCIAKGRDKTARGAAKPNTKLTEDQVRSIRSEHAAGGRGTLARLARTYSVNKSTLQDLLSGKSWAHVS